MCQSPYTLVWNMSSSHCPNLIESIDEINNHRKSVHISIRWGGKFVRTWSSLVHVWSSWYREYYEAITPSAQSQSDNKMLYDGYNKHKIQTQSLLPPTTERIPRLMIRFEDLLFHAEEVVEQIRQCVGASWKIRNDTSTDPASNGKSPFRYGLAPAKTHPYFSSFKKHQSSLVSAIIKYGQEGSNGRRRVDNMTDADIAFAKRYIDNKILDVFNYNHPNVG
jgi:hypothetical protein